MLGQKGFDIHLSRFVHPNSPSMKCSIECFGQSIINNLLCTIHASFSHQCSFEIHYLHHNTVCTPNDCVLFVHVKLTFVALLSGTICVDGSSPIFVFGAVNWTEPEFIIDSSWWWGWCSTHYRWRHCHTDCTPEEEESWGTLLLLQTCVEESNIILCQGANHLTFSRGREGVDPPFLSYIRDLLRTFRFSCSCRHNYVEKSNITLWNLHGLLFF